MILELNPNGVAVSDFDLDEFFNDNKDKAHVIVANATIVDRFALGVLRREIDEVELYVTDYDGTTLKSVIDNEGISGIPYRDATIKILEEIREIQRVIAERKNKDSNGAKRCHCGKFPVLLISESEYPFEFKCSLDCGYYDRPARGKTKQEALLAWNSQ